MDGSAPEELYLLERRRRLAAERTLDRTRQELTRAHQALVANADRLSLRYLSQKETNLRLSDRQAQVLAQRKEAADKADRARRRLWHALETMRDGFALFDADLRLVAANSVYLGLFDVDSTIGPGATAAEMFTAAAEEGAFDLSDLEPDEWAAVQLARWDADPIGMQILHTFDGRAIRFQDRRAPDGDIVCLAVDITDIEERESSLAAARDAAEDVSRAKAAFLARMSHEMRTPMNGVLGLASMLADRDLDEESRICARTIRDSAEALLVIVNDTLDVSRLEAGRVQLRAEPFDLEATLCDCLRLAAAGAAVQGVEVVLNYPLNAPTGFLGDQGRVRQVVMNMVGNGLKFTDAGHVAVSVAVTAGPDGAGIAIDVTDTGPGVPAERRQDVFEAFTQVEDGRPQKEGTGLGLTISRGLAERMGGTIALVDAPDMRGACFRFTLTLPLHGVQPVAVPPGGTIAIPPDAGVQGDALAARLTGAGVRVLRASSGGDVLLAPVGASGLPDARRLVLFGPVAAVDPTLAARVAAVLPLPVAGAALLAALDGAADGAGAMPAAARPRVLIADDNATNRFLLEKMLGSETFVLDVVSDGAQAVAAYSAARPDVVLMDISMPVLDGFGAAAAIAAAEAAAGRTPAPIIALTAHTGAEMSERLRVAGFAAHQTKPVRKDALLAAIAAALA